MEVGLEGCLDMLMLCACCLSRYILKCTHTQTYVYIIVYFHFYVYYQTTVLDVLTTFIIISK